MPDPRFSWPIAVRGRSHYEYEPRFVEPVRTLDERRAALAEHKIVTCTCTRVEGCEPEGEAKLIYDPECKVHARKVRI